MEEKIRKALEAKFSNESVRKRKGSFGKTISYVEANAVIGRLNDCCESEWSFTIISHQELSTGEILVHGRLEVFGIKKEAFGRGFPAVSKDTGEVISAVDAYKAACSDSLKKCATLFGVATHLYSDDPQEEEQPRNTTVRKLPPTDRLSQKQLSTIWSMGRNLGLNAEQVRQLSVNHFGVSPEQLTKSDASVFITKLAEELDEKRGAA